MPPATSSPTPYRFENLPAISRNEVVLWNWYCRIAPTQVEWRSWVAEILGHLVEKPVGQKLQLVQTHQVDTKFGEKVLDFGSKQEVFFGRDTGNDVVLAASAIAGKQARLFIQDGKAYLEDLGGRLGTYLWDNRIPSREKQLLGSGDQFTIFPYRFRALVEHCWSPETDVAVSECRLEAQSRAEFLGLSPPGARTFVVKADTGRGRAVLQVSSGFLEKLQQRILAPLGLQRIKNTVPSDDAFLGFVMLAFLERLNRGLKFPDQFSFAKASREMPADSTRGMTLSFAVGVGGLTGPFRIFLPLEFLPAGKSEAAGVSAVSFPGELCWKFPVSAGFVDLSPDEIAQVGLGDILVAQNAPATLFPKDFSKGWTMVAEGSNFVRFKFDKYFEGGLPVESGSDTTKATKAAIETLPLRLHVVVGERELSLAEIQALNPGTIIELDANKSAPVRLMVNGRILGEGELVEVEGSLAVKVLRWRSS